MSLTRYFMQTCLMGRVVTTSIGIDILSNGFKLKADTAGYSNYNGWSYLYCAWAEAPAFNLYGAQSNAR